MLKLYNTYNSPADRSIKFPNKYFTELKNTQFSRGEKNHTNHGGGEVGWSGAGKQVILLLSAGKRKLPKRRFLFFPSSLWSSSALVAGSRHLSQLPHSFCPLLEPLRMKGRSQPRAFLRWGLGRRGRAKGQGGLHSLGLGQRRAALMER